MADETPTVTNPSADASSEPRILEERIIPHEKVAAVPNPPTPPTPPVAPATPVAPAEPSPIIPATATITPTQQRDDIAHILEEVKLPERREAPTVHANDAKPASPTYDTQLVSKALGEQQPNPDMSEHVPLAAPTTPLADASPVVSLHTLKDDLQQAVRVQKMSLVRAVALEGDKKRPREESSDEPVARKRSGVGMLIVLGIILLAGSGFLGAFLLAPRATVPTPSQSTSILFAENTVTLPIDTLSSSELKRMVAQAQQGLNAQLGSITRIVPAITANASTYDASGNPIGRPATFEEFMSALGTRAPPDLVRALGDTFFFGIHVVDKNAPVFVIPVLSYQRAFADMLAWEPTMDDDLQPVFTAVPDQTINANGLPEQRRFSDLVMRNYDVRALKDDAGHVVLYYSFPTQNLLVIGQSTYSFDEILARLRAAHQL